MKVEKLRIAFVSTSISPYCIPSRKNIDMDKRIIARHFFARKIEPGRQWKVETVPSSFQVVSGVTLKLGNKFIYMPTGLMTALKKFKPDVIISEQLGSLLIFTYFYSLYNNVPVLLRWEGTLHTEKRYSHGLRYLMRKKLSRLAKGFLCYSPKAEKYIHSLGVTGSLYKIPYSIDEENFNPPENYDERNPNIFLYVGQLIERKGIKYLLNAFSEIIEEEPDAELWVIGDGPLKNDLINSLNKNILNKIKWYGFCEPEKVSKLMHKAGVFICPTLEDHGPMVQIEAAKCGMPIISSIYSGNAELVVEQGVNGYIVNSKNVTELADVMIRMIKEKNKIRMYNKSVELGQVHTSLNESNQTVDIILDFLRNNFSD